MKRLSKHIFIAILLGQVFTVIVLAEPTKILTGRDLLKAVRQNSGYPKPAYSKRPLKAYKPLLIKKQTQTQLKTTTSLIPKVKEKRTYKPTKTKTAFYKSSKKIHNISALTSNTPFSRAIDILRNSTQPPLKIVVFWRDLQENADVNPTSPINFEPIPAVSLKTTLELLLESVSDTAKLDYVVDNGIIMIATEQSLPKKYELRVYNISDLLAKPADFRGSLSGSRTRGASRTTDSFDEMVDWD